MPFNIAICYVIVIIMFYLHLCYEQGGGNRPLPHLGYDLGFIGDENAQTIDNTMNRYITSISTSKH